MATFNKDGTLNKAVYEKGRKAFLDMWENTKKRARKEKFIKAFLRRQ